MRLNPICRTGLAAVFLAALWGCGGEAALTLAGEQLSSSRAELGTLTGLAVTPSSARVFKGTTGPFKAIATYSDGTTQDVTTLATWSSANTAVATVNAQGVATAVAISGSTTLTASYGGFTATGGITATSFVTPGSSYYSGYPVDAVTADFNGDARPDVAVANCNYGVEYVGVHIHNGIGFNNVVMYGPGGSWPIAITAGDVNNDGKNDLAVVVQKSNRVSIMLGRGDGTFQLPTLYPVGYNPRSVALGDFNGDGWKDLAVTNNYGSSSSVSILINQGNGTFGPQTAYPLNGAHTVAVADLNADGALDLAITDGIGGPNSSVHILRGNGNGTFQAQVTYPTGYYSAEKLALADMNGDGQLDLVMTLSGRVGIMLNSNGTFPTSAHTFLGLALYAIAAADMNQDGRMDVLLATGNNTLLLMIGNGNGTLQAPISHNVNYSPQQVLAADFSLDGRPDMASANFAGAADVRVFRQY